MSSKNIKYDTVSDIYTINYEMYVGFIVQRNSAFKLSIVSSSTEKK